MAALLAADRYLSEELLSLRVYALLAGAELRRASQSCRRWLGGLRAAPRVVQERARWRWRWSRASSHALIHGDDACAVRGGGGWHPGAVAIADLRLTADSEAAWRVDSTGAGEAASQEAMEEGYAYIMGRNDAPADRAKERCTLTARRPQVHSGHVSGVQTASRPGGELMRARAWVPEGPLEAWFDDPQASMFYGGRSLRCCFSTGDSSGPRIDYVQADGRLVDACLSRLRHVGDWVEFHLSAGVLSAVDFKGHTFVWSGRLPAGTAWYPTLAWTGSSAVLCLTYPEHFAAAQQPREAPGGT
ncbi:unnamed protein product [Prorocentrum cordatum]|uniref:F-box domain-containing protein n=1 Tax=Prorocentrum cordatum TaxID=2364126 RepID=A0ABN9X0R1_9DINO|nr:unnamed protein product [Polarella glacialis]